MVFSGSASKLLARFDDFRLKTSSYDLMIWAQNQSGYSLSVASQNRQHDGVGAGHTSRSSCLLHMEVSQFMFSKSGLKTCGGVTWMVHVTSSQRLHRDQVKDGWVDVTGYVRPCYHYFTVFHVFDIFVFSLCL
jgi:hypothetical protein